MPPPDRRAGDDQIPALPSLPMLSAVRLDVTQCELCVPTLVTICLGPSDPVPETPLCTEPGATSWPQQPVYDPMGHCHLESQHL